MKVRKEMVIIFSMRFLQLLDSAVYTLGRFFQPSTRLQSSQVPDKMERAKERVFKVKMLPWSHPVNNISKYSGWTHAILLKNTLIEIKETTYALGNKTKYGVSQVNV